MNFLKKMVVILIAIQNNFNPFSRNIKPTYLNKFGNVEDIANVALFLGSENSNYITGQVIHVDGGMAM